MYQRPNAYESRLHQLFNLDNSIARQHLFTQLALEAFEHQYHHNPIYTTWCNLRGAHPTSVTSIDAIPFLPISVYRSKSVSCFDVKDSAYFMSSQTGGESASRHYIYELAFYYRHLKRCFEFALGPVTQYSIIGLLPHYLDRPHSSLIAMCSELMRLCGQDGTDFFTVPNDGFKKRLYELKSTGKTCIVFGVRFAFTEWANQIDFGTNTILIETGGMKNRGPEMSRQAFNAFVLKQYNPKALYSEYGMTELFSQCYAIHDKPFISPPSLQVFARSEINPNRRIHSNYTGALDIIDLANIDTCCFLATDDVGTIQLQNSFEMLGRLDSSVNRGCHALWPET